MNQSFPDSRVDTCLLIFLTTVCLHLAACAADSNAARGAARGASTGAVTGAVGGLVTSLVFGGDPVDAAARGAVYGGAVGATAGAMRGRQVDKRIEAQREAGLQQLRRDIGDDAFTGLEALADCEHPRALSQAKLAEDSRNPNFALAGLWLEVLTVADQGDTPGLENLWPVVVERDWDIESAAQAASVTSRALQELRQIRADYGRPRECPG